jgi:hypothetical protein
VDARRWKSVPALQPYCLRLPSFLWHSLFFSVPTPLRIIIRRYLEQREVGFCVSIYFASPGACLQSPASGQCIYAMPPSTTGSSLGPGKIPKLRSSCDGCGVAKVKCDRSQPECGRCAALGLSCVYGLSRQFGKPRRKRLATGVDAAARRINHVEHRDEARNCPANVVYGQPASMNQLNPPGYFNPVDAIPPATSDLTSNLGTCEQNDYGSDLFAGNFFADWSQLDGAVISAPATDPDNFVRTNSTFHHSCPREPYEILRDLICPSFCLHAPEAGSNPVSAQLDQVLSCTRHAINRLTQLLKCPCARSGHRIMVHASIISRILLWYQQAAGWTCSNASPSRVLAIAHSTISNNVPASSPSPSAENANSLNPSTLAQSTGFVVEHVPVSIGTFNIEDQNVQAAFRDQLVLSGLKKTASLIELFMSQAACESTANGVTGLYTHIGTWLWGEHSRTVTVLKTRLSSLNAD